MSEPFCINPKEKRPTPRAFGRPEDDKDEPQITPPGFVIQRGRIPSDANFGQLLVCRAYGSVVGPRSANIEDRVEFHDILSELVDNSLRARYSPRNPKVVPEIEIPGPQT